ncbi:pyridoxamine 5'-phosphate oxidase-like protein (plasmid) [Rhizobium sp. CIAT894]|uniref:pyridoxamine 5'-phosphate oxidase family protein n=1 Tax=Rhizobium sp. CIAT894 TaxID=2020312 RepID=UPI000A1E1DEA|nr:pyridoxamine 5'-phosphate oxidase family protein [Rhizobium sp. CIAT894]ARM92165.1 pyridoxamine 5'-phosphate oxidase-like protein [Rhizobium sp. CIAT894]
MSLGLREYTQAECYSALEEARFGHLACCKDSQPYVVPIYFSYDNGVAYCFSMPGRKLEWMRENDKVCLQVDQRVGGGWASVIVEGRFEEFPDADVGRSQRLHAWELLQKHSDWWEVGSLKPKELPVLAESPHVFFGIFVHALSGRVVFRSD